MPIRKVIFADGEYYHIFNRIINKESLFRNNYDLKRALSTLSYYQYINLPTRFSIFLSFGYERRNEILRHVNKEKKLIEVICFCFMPNHYHLLIKQLVKGGISSYIRLFQNSFTRFFNIKHKRSGYLFEGQFKAVQIEDNNQLLQLSRYIHLNPYASYVVKSVKALEEYPYSSLPIYFRQETNELIIKKIIVSQFKSIESYRKFVLDEADYQRERKKIQHLTLE